MKQTIAALTLLVREYDEAIEFFTRALCFTLIEDSPLDNGKRWVVVAPASATGARLLLGRAANPQQQAAVGNQGGGRVFLFLHTDNFSASYAHMQAQGVKLQRSRARRLTAASLSSWICTATSGTSYKQFDGCAQPKHLPACV